MKALLYKILPSFVLEKRKDFKQRMLIKKVSRLHPELISAVKKKEKIKIAFLVLNESIWKYEELYELLKKDERFQPVVFVCPFLTNGEEYMYAEMERTYSSFLGKGYEVVETYKKEKGTWLDVKKEFQPDIVFFTNPWNHTKEEYRITNFLDTLTCYVPYGFKISHLYQAHFNKLMHNLVWKFFVETTIHHELARKYSRNNAGNVVVSGFPGMDGLLKTSFEAQNVWKREKLKKIIWAPHHTIPGDERNLLDYSTFLDYAEFMFQMADKYKNEIQIAFKPHPNLKGKLRKRWGDTRTNEYYTKWENLSNGQLEEGSYTDLFFTSDGLIHDSGSFLIEYLYTSKPVMFLINEDSVKEQFNEIGKRALEVMEKGYGKADIEKFIINVIQEKDRKKKDREIFFDEIVKPPGGNLASENIYKHLIASLA